MPDAYIFIELMHFSYSALNVRWFGKTINFVVGKSSYIGVVTSDLVGGAKALAVLERYLAPELSQAARIKDE